MPVKINRNKKSFSDLSKNAQSRERAGSFSRRWGQLCERYLPLKVEDSFWRFNRETVPREPSQGWKLHISATILEACDLFERVAPFLNSEDVQFKAPNSLETLSNLNCGLQHGYHQVGKFITIYPSNDAQALALAASLHELTKDFFPVLVPFDEQYSPGSSVFYRYGGFSKIEITGEDGEKVLAIKDQNGQFIPDDRLQAVPDWAANPFPTNGSQGENTFADTPLGTTHRIFRAITQRGKGGTYEAIDFSQSEPELCIVKEGRKNGELGWNGQDGYFLVRNEFENLKILKKKYEDVPQVFLSFEVHGNFYFVMEYVEGTSLKNIMKGRQRRFSVRLVLDFGLEIAKIIEKIHKAGWVWNDCKPANLIVTKTGSLRPIDFENAHPLEGPELFDWKSRGFVRSQKSRNESGGSSVDIYALGAVIYFLLTGRLYDDENPTAIGKLRRNVPSKLTKITEKLLSDQNADISKVIKELERIRI